MISIICKYANYKNEKEVIVLQCPKNSALNKIFSNSSYIHFSGTLQAWYIEKNKQNLRQLITDVKAIAIVNIENLKQTKPQQTTKQIIVTNNILLSNISSYNCEQLKKFIQLLILKGYSVNTIRTYKNEFTVFLKALKQIKVDSLGTNELKKYFIYCYTILKLKENTLHSRINALKFYYEQVLHREKFFWEIPRPKKQFIIPKVISEEKIIASLFKVKNLKHKTLLLLAYSAGLRVSEVVHLTINNIDSDRMQITVQNSKGKKDRVITLSKAILILLRQYYLAYKPQYWLFEGQEKGTPYSIRSAQIIFKDAIKQLKLPSQISFHSLRHSYATHLLDNGTDIKYIQNLLGHNDIKTTLRYLHVTNRDLKKIESPLDRILQHTKEVESIRFLDS
ncbi:MAG: tyrosine-type recombinase/integrase [Bacteroidetes bacterium]|nr:tyrosine-type recombinase/integrase [Bacteroidota bacterium]MBS1649493.1 tyrosine-type recombinase/integrase [Bacteroidota bacterium]